MSEEDAPIEKDAPQGGEILAGALSVRQAKEALRQRSAVPSGCRYTRPGQKQAGALSAWVREQVPHMERIEERWIRPGHGPGWHDIGEAGFTIRLDEKKIHIFQVEEGYEDRGRPAIRE